MSRHHRNDKVLERACGYKPVICVVADRAALIENQTTPSDQSDLRVQQRCGMKCE